MPSSPDPRRAARAEQDGPLPSRYDAFLHAAVGTGRDHPDLSVLSMLARLGKDPWAEAAWLATVPRAAAVDSLAATIGSLPDGGWQPAGVSAIAGRLVILLGHRADAGPTFVGAPLTARGKLGMLAAGALGAAMALAILLLELPI